jgi:hypothetical protein
MWSADDGSRRIDEELVSVDSLKHVLASYILMMPDLVVRHH